MSMRWFAAAVLALFCLPALADDSEKIVTEALQKAIPSAKPVQIVKSDLPGFYQAIVHQLLITLEDRERIDAIFGCDSAYRGQRIALFENAVQNHRDNPVAKLAVNRLTVIPLTVHQGYRLFL